MNPYSWAASHGWPWCGLALAAVLAGCDQPLDRFQTNRIYAKRLELTADAEMDSILSETHLVLEELFGTPNEPRWPAVFAGDERFSALVSLDRLQRAAGAVRSDEQDVHYGLYREHCVDCHGLTGDGLGPASRLLNPYPRDFRLGKIKYKRTPHGKKPTRDDLRWILQHGIVGTGMPSFRLLNEEDLEALIDYVIYLSIRGEVERKLLTEAAFEMDWEGGERFSLASDEPNSVQTIVQSVSEAWAAAAESLLPVSPPEEMETWAASSNFSTASPDALQTSIDNGRQLFSGKVANCASCHGPRGEGDGVTTDFDDWTKDWTVQAGLDPRDKEQLEPMLELGALKPRAIQPRNLHQGNFRGGSTPEDLYRRIVHGIDGTPMPSVPLKPENPQGLSQREVWDLVNYLLSLSVKSEHDAPPAPELAVSRAKSDIAPRRKSDG